MSDYKSMRMKKNAQITEAISNIRKDLYDWKPSTLNLVKPNRTSSNTSQPVNLKSPIFPAPPPKLKSLDSTLIMKRTNSLKDLNKKSKHLESNLNRPVSGNSKLKKLDDLETDKFLKDSHSENEFLTSFKPVQNFESNERIYLNSARSRDVQTNQSTNKEEEFMLKLNQKDSLLVNEMDLSQFNLSSIVKNLQKFQNLKLLDLSCNKIKKIENLNFKYLNELRLYANQIEIVENLDNLIELQSLQLQSNRIKCLNKSLSSLKMLEYLRLDQNEIDSISFSDISSCHNLIYLNVSYNNLESIGFINCLPNLEELYASNLRLRSLEDLDPNRLRKLTDLDLSNNQLNDQQTVYLANIKSLNILKISNNSLNSVKHISTIKSLKSLDLSFNQIEIIQDLASLNELETLDLTANNIIDWFQIENLVKCDELIELQINRNPIMKLKTLIDVSNALPSLKFIDDQQVECLNNIESETRLVKNKNSLEMNKFKFDLNNFELEMKNYDEKFMKQFEEIKKCLNKIDLQYSSQSKNSEPDNQFQSASFNNQKKLSKNRLMDALYYSKQLGDNIE